MTLENKEHHKELKDIVTAQCEKKLTHDLLRHICPGLDRTHLNGKKIFQKVF